MSSDSELVFMMGEYKASFPTDRYYAKNHMWAKPTAKDERPVLRFGFSAYAVRLLQDIYFFDLNVEPGMQLQLRQEIGSIESKKAESSLYAPVEGEVIAINQAYWKILPLSPWTKYGNGWLFESQQTKSNF